jgi:hypothetical protein
LAQIEQEKKGAEASVQAEGFLTVADEREGLPAEQAVPPNGETQEKRDQG